MPLHLWVLAADTMLVIWEVTQRLLDAVDEIGAIVAVDEWQAVFQAFLSRTHYFWNGSSLLQGEEYCGSICLIPFSFFAELERYYYHCHYCDYSACV